MNFRATLAILFAALLVIGSGACIQKKSKSQSRTHPVDTQATNAADINYGNTASEDLKEISDEDGRIPPFTLNMHINLDDADQAAIISTAVGIDLLKTIDQDAEGIVVIGQSESLFAMNEPVADDNSAKQLLLGNFKNKNKNKNNSNGGKSGDKDAGLGSPPPPGTPEKKATSAQGGQNPTAASKINPAKGGLKVPPKSIENPSQSTKTQVKPNAQQFYASVPKHVATQKAWKTAGTLPVAASTTGGQKSKEQRIKDLEKEFNVNSKIEGKSITVRPGEAPDQYIAKGGLQLFRGLKVDSVLAHKILENGLEPPVSFNLKAKQIGETAPLVTDLKTHQSSFEASSRSIFLSTSYNPDLAMGFANEDGVVFVLRSRDGQGIDVNQNINSPFLDHEREVALVGKVRSEDIAGFYVVRKVNGKLQLGDFHANQKFKGGYRATDMPQWERKDVEGMLKGSKPGTFATFYDKQQQPRMALVDKDGKIRSKVVIDPDTGQPTVGHKATLRVASAAVAKLGLEPRWPGPTIMSRDQMEKMIREQPDSFTPFGEGMLRMSGNAGKLSISVPIKTKRGDVRVAHIEAGHFMSGFATLQESVDSGTALAPNSAFVEKKLAALRTLQPTDADFGVKKYKSASDARVKAEAAPVNRFTVARNDLKGSLTIFMNVSVDGREQIVKHELTPIGDNGGAYIDQAGNLFRDLEHFASSQNPKAQAFSEVAGNEVNLLKAAGNRGKFVITKVELGKNVFGDMKGIRQDRVQSLGFIDSKTSELQKVFFEPTIDGRIRVLPFLTDAKEFDNMDQMLNHYGFDKSELLDSGGGSAPGKSDTTPFNLSGDDANSLLSKLPGNKFLFRTSSDPNAFAAITIQSDTGNFHARVERTADGRFRLMDDPKIDPFPDINALKSFYSNLFGARHVRKVDQVSGIPEPFNLDSNEAGQLLLDLPGNHCLLRTSSDPSAIGTMTIKTSKGIVHVRIKKLPDGSIEPGNFGNKPYKDLNGLILLLKNDHGADFITQE